MKTTEPKRFIMFHPGKSPDGKGTYLEHPLTAAKDRDEAYAIAMGIVRALELKEMHLVEEPGTLVFRSWPLKSSNG